MDLVANSSELHLAALSTRRRSRKEWSVSNILKRCKTASESIQKSMAQSWMMTKSPRCRLRRTEHRPRSRSQAMRKQEQRQRKVAKLELLVRCSRADRRPSGLLKRVVSWCPELLMMLGRRRRCTDVSTRIKGVCRRCNGSMDRCIIAVQTERSSRCCWYLYPSHGR